MTLQDSFCRQQCQQTMSQAELFDEQTMVMEAPTVCVVIETMRHEDEPEPLVLEEIEEVEEIEVVAYTTHLVDYPHSTPDVVRVSEQRFRRELEKQLGADVLPTLRAYQNASESSDTDLTKTEIALAKRWAKAYDAARTAGFRDLGDTDEAYFEVRPV